MTCSSKKERASDAAQAQLKRWFNQEKRDFPWRNNPSPYAVWISEVMLQQTQAAVVVSYFERWMKQFPTIVDLAAAPLDAVIKAWEGLGYYSRARNIHSGAQKIVECYGGEIPDTYEKLNTIKGLGPYTIGAILSFAFHKKIAAVDGNVVRVLARWLMIEEDIAKPRTIENMRHIVEEMLPDDEPWVINEALIELGATLCKRQPQCFRCPLQTSCKGLEHGVATQLPYKSKRTSVQPLHRLVLVIQSDDYFLVQRRQEGEIMSDLHEFPFIEISPKQEPCPDDGCTYVTDSLGLQPTFLTTLPPVTHTFTRYRAQLTPMFFQCQGRPEVTGSKWMKFTELSEVAFSSGHRRILNQILSQEIFQ